jgi:hypothetical protein
MLLVMRQTIAKALAREEVSRPKAAGMMRADAQREKSN